MQYALVQRWLAIIGVVASVFALPSEGRAAQLYIGAASTSITPDQPVALMGQRHTRISQAVESPCLAFALAIESREQDQRSVEQAIFVSCDLSFIPYSLRDKITNRLKDQAAGFHVAGFNLEKLVISATHTHTAPVIVEGVYDLPSAGIMQPKEYIEFAVDQIAGVIQRAWHQRAPASVGWGLGHAVVARNRLAVYADGKAQMYGATTKPDFLRLEGYEDHGVEVLFFWNETGKLVATAVNVACPAQDVSDRYTINADFWHPVREQLRKQYGDDLIVLGWTGAAGDQSPWPMLRKPAEQRMLKLRNISSLDDIARRIVGAWQEAYEAAQQEKHAEPRFVHHVETIKLPMRQVSQADYLEAQTKAKSYADNPKERWNLLWHQKVIDRFESQRADDVYNMALHVVRLGDVAIATNEFELYTDYGVQIKARSPALQTFLIQLAGPGSYLPADRSIAGGGYGSVIQSGLVGPEGGRLLVDKTLSAINGLGFAKHP